MYVTSATSVWILTVVGAWSSGTVTSRRHDDRHQHHHHHRELSSSTSRLVYCEQDDDCRRSNDAALKGGETCHWLYDGCEVGICMCDPLSQKRHPRNGQCIPARYGGDSCNASEPASCPVGMFCSPAAVCECRVGQMTSDRQFCLRYHQKLVGSTCTPHMDTCYQRAVYGYTSSEVRCHTSSRRCECNGERQQGITCSTWKLYEVGCTKFYHCEGGAICVDRRCVCPTGYTGASSGDYTKCVKRDALRDLPLGAECDEINELRYCARGLVCQRCSPHDHAFRCLRFRLTAMMEQLRYYGGSGSSMRPSYHNTWSLLATTGLFTALTQRTCKFVYR